MAVVPYSKNHVTIETLMESLQERFSQESLDLVIRVWTFASNHYAKLMHPTDIPYTEFACGVAKLLYELGTDPLVVSAVLLYPPPSVEETVLDDLRKTFKDQEELIKLVEEVLQLDHFLWDVCAIAVEQNGVERREVLRKMFLLAIDDVKSEEQEHSDLTAAHFQKKEKQVENLIRMFLAAATDTGALIIKLADRLHFIKLLKDLPESQKESLDYALRAKIALVVYAPLADRLGMWRLKSELEDMAFRLLDMRTFKEIAGYLASTKKDREDYISHQIIPELKRVLEEYGIEAEIYGRAKHIYSIYKKMAAKQLRFEEINDLLGVRIIVDTKENCYDVQDIIQDCWPVETEVYGGEKGRDWIANPKENQYQSLHTTVRIADKMVEVQIRTHEMHEIAEYGAAAEHWRYKEDKAYRKGKIARVTKEKDQIWSKQLAEMRRSLEHAEAITSLEQKRLLKKWIFVITPKGHVIDLRAGATPLDFAYRIHTDLGHRYTGAKVDGRIVRLDYELKNGEMVELITSRAGRGPTAQWLSRSKDEDGNSKYVFARTRQARNKIHSWLNKHNPKVAS